jgi:hypothetical protein
MQIELYSCLVRFNDDVSTAEVKKRLNLRVDVNDEIGSELQKSACGTEEEQ